MNTRLLVLVLACVPNLLECRAADEGELATRFAQEYPIAVERLRERIEHGSTLVQMWKLDGNSETLFKTIEYKSDGPNQLVSYWFESEIAQRGQNAKTTIVYGPSKTFRIAKSSESSYQALSVSRRDEVDSALTSVIEPIFVPVAIFGKTTIDEAEQQEIIESPRLAEIDNGLVVIEYQYRSGNKPRGKTVLNPGRSWVAVRHELQSAAGEMIRSYDMRYTDDDLPILKSIQWEERDGEQSSKYRVDVKSYVPGDPPLSDFTLEHYGLPESLGDPEPRNWRTPVILILLVVGGIFAIRLVFSRK